MIRGVYPLRKLLIIAEHELPALHSYPSVARIFANVHPYLRQKKVLKYEVTIRQRSIADFTSRSPCPSPSHSRPSSDGDSGHDDHPDRDYPARPGCGGPTLHGFPCTPGVDDETAFTTGGSSSTHSRRAPTASGTGEPVTMEVASDQDKGIHAFPPGPPPPSSIAL